MIRQGLLRQLLLPSAQVHLSLSAAVQQALPSILPAVPQLQWAPQWQQTCSAATAKTRQPPTRHERNVANHRYCQRRAAWRRQLKELRKQWWQEHLERVAAHKASAELVKQQVEQLRQLRDEGKQMDREKHKLEREIREAERAVEVAGLRLASSYREQMRQDTLNKFKQSRRDKLLADSRYWVAPEALEARIAAALDNPVPLGATD